jgi:hypothetical protein
MNEPAAGVMWHIDQRCTNCDAARQLAPGLIAEVAGRSSVIRQPRTQAQEQALDAAAFACHTRSIRRGARGPGPKYTALGPVTDVLLTHRDHAARTPTGSAPVCGSTKATWPPRQTPTASCAAPSRCRSPKA